MVRIAHVQDFGWRRRGMFGALGLRPVNGLHTVAERDALQRAAGDKRVIVEIGVAEGASAAEMRQVMHPDGELFLIDPWHLYRLPGPLRFGRIIARRAVGSVKRGRVTWIEDFSVRVADGWNREIDLLYIDGDHELPGVRDDWEKWSPWIRTGGLVALHDSNPAAPWIGKDYGPVQVVRSAVASPEWRVIDEVDSMTVLRREPAPR